MTDIVKQAIAEKLKLEQELKLRFAQHPLAKKIRMLDDIIANFGESVTAKVDKNGSKVTKLDQIHELARDCIASNAGHAKLAEIHDYIVKAGLKVKIGMVKSYMYKYKDLTSSRDKGFSVRK